MIPRTVGPVTSLDSRGVLGAGAPARAGYRGDERRGLSSARTALGAAPAGWLERVLLAAIPLLAVAVAVVGAMMVSLPDVLNGLGSTTAAVLAACAAAFCFARTRLTGQSNAAAVGVGLAGLALLQLVWAYLDGVPAGTTAAWTAGRAAGTATVALVLVDAVRAPVVDTGFRPLRVLVWAFLAGAVAAGTGAVIGADPRLGGPVVVTLLWSAVGTGLTVAALWCHRRSRRDSAAAVGRIGVDWLAAVLGALALGCLFEALAVATGRPGWAAGARVMSVGAAGAGVTGAARDVIAAFTSQRSRLLEWQVDREAAAAVREEQTAERRKRTHDVRSALTGIGGATTTLERYRDRLDDEQRARLQTAVQSEVARLQALIEPRSDEDVGVSFAVEEAVATLSIGLRGPILLDVPAGLEAFGFLSDVAAALRHLVEALHATDAESVVSVVARRVGAHVRFQVAVSTGTNVRDIRADRLAVLAARQLMERSEGDVDVEAGSAGARYRLHVPSTRPGRTRAAAQ